MELTGRSREKESKLGRFNERRPWGGQRHLTGSPRPETEFDRWQFFGKPKPGTLRSFETSGFANPIRDGYLIFAIFPSF
ncbi:hypothetical protein RRSWK_01475 [Rhodopirellula sp. SWK7]|nr:hypothetical protein RRSWK_01475 [Rhodopirellula sp. SWK7]